MPIVVSMENQYVTPEGTLTYEGQDLLQSLLEAAETVPSAGDLEDLTDVSITTPTTGQILRYNGTTWANVSTGTPILLATRTASASATLDFTEFDNAVYRQYLFDLENVRPATDATILWGRVSTNAGSSYDAGATDYSYAGLYIGAGGGLNNEGSTGITAMRLTSVALTVGNAAGELGVNGTVRLFNAGNASAYARGKVETSYEEAGSGLTTKTSYWTRRNLVQDTDAFRFLFSSGNITSGTVRMYGIT